MVQEEIVYTIRHRFLRLPASSAALLVHGYALGHVPADKLPDWAKGETEAASGSNATQHLWEESWDDDDTNDDFSAQLKCVSPLCLLPPFLTDIETSTGLPY